MNRNRRKELQSVIRLLGSTLKMTNKKDAVEALESARRDLDMVRDDEEAAMDALPENFFLTDRYSDMEQNVSDIDDILPDLEDILDDVKSLKKFNAEFARKPISDIVSSIQKVIDR